jgi:hypothetical protein
MAVLLLWGANEVFNLSINYSFKNLLIVACVFFAGKVRTKVKFPGSGTFPEIGPSHFDKNGG